MTDDDYISVEGFGMFRRAAKESLTTALSRFPCLPGHEDQFGYLLKDGKPIAASHISHSLSGQFQERLAQSQESEHLCGLDI